MMQKTLLGTCTAAAFLFVAAMVVMAGHGDTRVASVGPASVEDVR